MAFVLLPEVLGSLWSPVLPQNPLVPKPDQNILWCELAPGVETLEEAPLDSAGRRGAHCRRPGSEAQGRVL